jgi:hypothetical protein
MEEDFFLMNNKIPEGAYLECDLPLNFEFLPEDYTAYLSPKILKETVALTNQSPDKSRPWLYPDTAIFESNPSFPFFSSWCSRPIALVLQYRTLKNSFETVQFSGHSAYITHQLIDLLQGKPPFWWYRSIGRIKPHPSKPNFTILNEKLDYYYRQISHFYREFPEFFEEKRKYREEVVEGEKWRVFEEGKVYEEM